VVVDEYKPTVDIPSPRDIVPNENIAYNKAKKTITIKGIRGDIWLTTVSDTNSMDPVMDYGHTCILTSDFNHEDLVIGSVVVYWNGERDIIHRITDIGDDDEGRFYILKGDNNSQPDNYIVRDWHIHWLLLGVIY